MCVCVSVSHLKSRIGYPSFDAFIQSRDPPRCLSGEICKCSAEQRRSKKIEEFCLSNSNYVSRVLTLCGNAINPIDPVPDLCLCELIIASK